MQEVIAAITTSPWPRSKLELLDLDAIGQLARLAELLVHRARELGFGGIEGDAVLRALRSGERGLDIVQVQLQGVGEDRVGRLGRAPQALRLGVGFDERDALRRAARDGQVVDGFLVDGEVTAGGAVFRGHVADRGAVRDRHVVKAGAVELDELADHALLAQHLRHGEHEVGRGDALAQAPGHLEADDLGNQHRDRLAQHSRLRLDAADPPAEHGQAVDHGGVRVGADQRVRVDVFDRLGFRSAAPHGLGQELQVDLVADAGAGRHDGEVREGELAPLQELVALAIALVLQLDVPGQGMRAAELVDDDRVVDDEVDRHERVDLARVAAEVLHGVAHGGEVDDGGNASKILHQDTGWAIGNLLFRFAPVVEPVGHRFDVGLGDRAAVLVAQQVFEKHPHGEGQLRDAFQAVLLSLDQRVGGVFLVADRECLAGVEAVERGGHRRFSSEKSSLRDCQGSTAVFEGCWVGSCSSTRCENRLVYV